MLTWLHAITAANITIVGINLFGMMFAPDLPGRFGGGWGFAGFMLGVWVCAVIGWQMAMA